MFLGVRIEGQVGVKAPIGSITPAHHRSFDVLGGWGVWGAGENSKISDAELTGGTRADTISTSSSSWVFSGFVPASTHQKSEWITGNRTRGVEESKGSNEEKIGLHDF